MPQESISKFELCHRLGIATRTAFKRRKDGKMPPHFEVKRHGTRHEVRYLVADVESFEKASPIKKPQ